MVKKSLLRHRVPAVPGGGTVFFVSRDTHSYLQEAEDKEEGGTPSIVEDIRGGLVMQLKRAITHQAITAANQHLAELVISFELYNT